jgi:hypothetical protein
VLSISLFRNSKRIGLSYNIFYNDIFSRNPSYNVVCTNDHYGTFKNMILITLGDSHEDVRIALDHPREMKMKRLKS